MGQALVFTNSAGQSITFSKQRSYLLRSITGTGATEVAVQTQKSPYQQGETYVDSLLEPRQIALEFSIVEHGTTAVFQRRRELSRVLNPLLGPGTLRYINNYYQYEISAVVEVPPIYPPGRENLGRIFQKGTLTFLCPDPLWRDIAQTVGSMVLWAGGLEFGTLEFPVEFGTSGSQYTAANTGDVPTPVQITIAGPCVNPVIDNLTTGKTLSIVQTVLAGESIEINTAFGQKKVEHVDEAGARTNVMHWLTDASELWELAVGDNRLKYNEISGAGVAGAVTVSWYNKYVGV